MRKRGRPPCPDILTPREWEVLALLREGLTNEQIAERLNITIHAARYHVSEILSKLGVSSRQEAAAWEPEKARPIWMSALAFAMWPLKHLPFGVAAKASAATVLVGAAGGIGFLVWGLVVTSGHDNGVGEGSAASSSATPTIIATAALEPPTETSEPAATPAPVTATVAPPTPFVTPTATPAATASVLTATPEPAPTPTLEADVCPPPNRTTPEDYPEPPGLPPGGPPGQRVQGGVAYSEAYLTLHLPQGRDFVILSGWSQDEANLVISVYDVSTESSLIIRADGCELWGLMRQPGADAVFDEIMGTLEIGAAYACPTPVRSVASGPPAGGPTGSVVQGGAPVQLGPMTLHLPAGREFTLACIPVDPGGTMCGLKDVQTGSSLSLRPDGCETGRRVSDPAADSVFDEIVATLEAPSR